METGYNCAFLLGRSVTVTVGTRTLPTGATATCMTDCDSAHVCGKFGRPPIPDRFKDSRQCGCPFHNGLNPRAPGKPGYARTVSKPKTIEPCSKCGTPNRRFDGWDSCDCTKQVVLMKERRRKSLKVLGLKPHELNAYYKTEHWIGFVKEPRKRAGGKCELCSVERPPLQVHHLSYDRLGHELPEDVKVICRPCHERIHGREFRAS